MITYGTVYIITQDFEKALEFYRKLFKREVIAQNKTRFASFRIDGLELSIWYFCLKDVDGNTIEVTGYYDDRVGTQNAE